MSTFPNICRTTTVVVFVAIFQSISAQLMGEAFTHGLNGPYFVTWLGMNFNFLLLLPKIIDTKRMNTDLSLWTLQPPNHSLVKEIGLMLLFFVLYAVANVCYTIALSKVSVAIVSSMFSSAPMFVVCLSIFFLNRSLRLTDILAVIVAVVGILLVAQPWHAHGSSVVSIVFGMLSPLAAAFYKVLFSKFFFDIGWIEVGVMLSKVSLINLFVGSVALEITFVLGGEVAPWVSHDPYPWGFIVGSSLAAVMFNFLVNYGVTITYPLFVSIGTFLSTAINLLWDGIIHDSWPSAMQWGGIVLIVLGFVILIFGDLIEAQKVPERDVVNDTLITKVYSVNTDS